jgi:integrase
MPAMVADILSWHRIAQDRDRQLLGDDWKGSEWELVFTSSRGTPIDDANLGHEFRKVLRRAGITRRVRLHDLRHSAATFWLAAGIRPRVVQELLGHSSIALTMNTYTHVLDELLKDAADAMDRTLGDPSLTATLTATPSDIMRPAETATD